MEMVYIAVVPCSTAQGSPVYCEVLQRSHQM